MPSPNTDDFFRAVYVHLFTRMGPRIKPDEVLRSARKVAEELLARCVSPVSWEAAAPTTISALRTAAMLYAPVRVAASITAMRTPELLLVPGEDGKHAHVLATGLELTDAHGETIATLDVTGEALVQKLEADRKRLGQIEFLGRPLAIPAGQGDARLQFVLEVFDVRRTSSIRDLIGATTAERDAALALLEDLRSRGMSPLDHVQRTLETGLGLVGLDQFPLLVQCLRFTILQAVSGGRINHAGGRLHALIVGPPAQGKKLIGLAARALNPRAQEASATKMSAAGLVGASVVGREGWRAQPGLLPQADEGVLVLQDAHGLTRNEVQRLGPLLQELIEDGVVRDSKAGGVRREVNVGLVLDANRASQLQAHARTHGAEAPILGLRPLLSRLDFIAEIPANPQRAWDVAARLYDVQQVARGRLDDEPWVRELRVLVATLRDLHADVDLDPVRSAMKAAHEAIQASNAVALAKMPEAGDLPARMAISFARLVAAAARARDGSIATAADVEEALVYLRRKLRFFALLAPAFHADHEASASDRRRAYYSRYAGANVRPADVARAYTEESGEAVSERTVMRDLHRFGAKRVAKGHYRLPPGNSAAE